MKRLIVCCDGTWQDLDCAYPTNVVKIAQAIKNIARDGTPQVLHYSEGVGTGLYKIDRVVGGAFGLGIDQRIQNTYRFLCCNYEPGDEIYLFGFSRGAYTVRSLAGLIYQCGILKRCHIRKTKEAYSLYRNRDIHPRETKDFREQFSVTPPGEEPGTPSPITLLGCWDTVGSLGVPNSFPLLSSWINRKYKFYDTTLNPTIQYALHAVAIDECRTSFDVTPMVRNDKSKHLNQVTEVWFAGTHGCIGGGTQVNQGLSDIALRWMMEQIKELNLGLEFVDNPNEAVEGGIKEDYSINFDATVKGIYAFLGTKNRQLIGQDLDMELIKKFFDSQIHESVKERWRLTVLNPLYRSKSIEVFQKWFDEITH